MPDQFEWKTEEDTRWEEELSAPAGPPVRRRRFWKGWIIGLVLILAGLLFVRWQVNEQVQATAQNVEADILSSHNLIWQAAAQRDEDLLQTFLSGRDDAWVDVQVQAVAEGWFGNPPFFGWTAVPPPLATSETVSITLAPDFRSAELEVVHRYQVRTPAGLTETVSLAQTAVYRQGRERWLLAPPEAEFWGGWIIHRRGRISLIYPARDETVALRLAADLDALLADVCRDLEGMVCSEDFHMEVRLEKDLQTLLMAAGAEDVLDQRSPLALPAPTLLGLPQDEAGYSHFFRAYAVPVATAAITNLTGYECCRSSLLMQGMVTRQLSQLGLVAWPLDQAGYDRLFAADPHGRVSPLIMTHSRGAPELTWLRIYAFIEFLEQQAAPGFPLGMMQQRLQGQPVPQEWLGQVLAPEIEPLFVETLFANYLYRQTTAGQQPQPSAGWPAPAVQLVCDGDTESVGIYTLDLATETWQQAYYQEYLPNKWAYVQPVNVQTDTYLITVRPLSSGPLGSPPTSEFVLVRDGQAVVTLEAPVTDGAEEAYDIYFAGADPDGRYLLFAELMPHPDVQPQSYLVDSRSCSVDGCTFEPLDSLLLWSPDGRRTLQFNNYPQMARGQSEPASAGVFRGDRRGQHMLRVAPEGRQPFWLTNEVYGYVRQDAAGEAEIVTAVSGQDRPRSLLTVTDLRQSVPVDRRPPALRVDYLYGLPSPEADRLFVATTVSAGVAEEERFFFEIVLSENLDAVQSVFWIPEVLPPGNQWLSLTSNGRWLMLADYSGTSGNTFTLIDRETGARQNLEQTSGGLEPTWSADGHWYVMNRGDHLVLGAPDHHYQRLIFHQFGECFRAYWLEAD